MEQEFTISLFTENHIGLLNHVTNILTRRQVNIESITASESAVRNVHLITLVVLTTEEMVTKASRQMDKLVDVLKVFVHETEELVHQEIAMYKVKTGELMQSHTIEDIVRNSNARFLEITPAYVVIEKTGHKAETSDLLEKLRPFGVLQFARSGRVAITKQRKELVQYLDEIDAQKTE